MLNRNLQPARTALERDQRLLAELDERQTDYFRADRKWPDDDFDRVTEMLDAARERTTSASEALKEAVSTAFLSYVIVGVPGEAACLAALAAGSGTTFELSLGALSLFAMGGLYIRSLAERFETPD
jgi:hypothetical protein